MRIGLAYNEKPDCSTTDEPPGTSDAFAEWDDPSTIAAVEEALGLFGSVTRLEADEFFPQKLALAHPDLVFNIAEGLHGQNRESLVPAICEYFNIPYTGSDPLTLALSLHKARTKELLAYRGVPTARFVCVDRPQDLARVSLPYPVFVKPVCEGSGRASSSTTGVRLRRSSGSGCSSSWSATPSRCSSRPTCRAPSSRWRSSATGRKPTASRSSASTSRRCRPARRRSTATRRSGGGTRRSIRWRSFSAPRPSRPSCTARSSARPWTLISCSAAATGAAWTSASTASAFPTCWSSTRSPESSPTRP